MPMIHAVVMAGVLEKCPRTDGFPGSHGPSCATNNRLEWWRKSELENGKKPTVTVTYSSNLPL